MLTTNELHNYNAYQALANLFKSQFTHGSSKLLIILQIVYATLATASLYKGSESTNMR